MFSEAFSHEAICLFLKTGSTEHILRKYKSSLNVTVHIDSVCHAPASKVFLKTDTSKHRMKQYKFRRDSRLLYNAPVAPIVSPLGQCEQPPCDQPDYSQAKAVCEANGPTPLHDQWPYAPHDKVLQYKVLLKVSKQSRGQLESMLNRIKLPMRPNREDSISQLAIRCVRKLSGLTPVTTDLDLFPSEGHGPIFPPNSWAKIDI